MQRSRFWTISAALAISGLVLTGCSNPIEDMVNNTIEEGVEGLVEEATGSDIEVDTDGSGADLPSSFPSDLPLPAGDLFASVGADGSYQLTYQVSDAGEGQKLVDQLVAAGYEITAESDLGPMKIWTLAGTYSVAVSVLDDESDDDPAVLSYSVTPLDG